MSGSAPVRVGVDLDNTLIDYDAAFAEVGVELGLLPDDLAVATKLEVRSHLRAGEDGERQWMYLQGQVYGRFIDRARLYEGVPRFLAAIAGTGAEVWIVSHKTRYGHFDENRVPLWDAARGWLRSQGLFDDAALGLAPERVVFEETRANKIARIGALRCAIFVDDLPEVLGDPGFPTSVQPFWFAPEGARQDAGLQPYACWEEITDAALRCLRRLTDGADIVHEPAEAGAPASKDVGTAATTADSRLLKRMND